MRQRWHRVGALLVLLVAVAAVGIWFVLGRAEEKRSQDLAQSVPKRIVPASWRDERQSPGHMAHLAHQVECDSCHIPGAKGFERPDSAVCSSCHFEPFASQHTGSADEPTTCMTCHVFSSATPGFDPWSCENCHGERGSHPDASFKAHSKLKCAECHRPHGEPRIVMNGCTSCHQDIKAQHGDVNPTAQCTTCHAPHATAKSAQACETCHAQGSLPVPHTALFEQGHKACTTCHTPHAFVKSADTSCTHCHQEEHELSALGKHVACTSCHVPHAIRKDNRDLCVECHQGIHVDHPVGEGTAQCLNCHQPHHVKVDALDACESCHALHGDKQDVHALKAACVDCHTPHHVKAQVESTAFCLNCHRAQASSTHAGHQTCTNCHGETLHGQGAPPTCETCHASQELPGLHAEPEHQECGRCHVAHEMRPLADRDSCGSCHQDIGAHEPNAKRCNGCHTFRD